MRIKICGITTPDDAVAAAAAGADAIGLNFVGGPRQIDTAQAALILRELPVFCTPVALVDVTHGDIPDDLLELLGRHWVSHVQLYGRVAPDTLVRLRADGFQPILVQHVVPGRFPNDIAALLVEVLDAPPAAVLLDAYREGQMGGTGQTLDWQVVADARAAGAFRVWPPIILAGGLNPENVAEAVRTVRPWGVDVSSGVESSVGRKDVAKMAAFVANARSADV